MPGIPIMRIHRRHLGALIFLALLCVPCALAKNGMQVVVVPVANMYAGPSDQTAVVSQAIYGSNVTLLTARGEWCRIQTADHYKGWIPSRHIRLIQNGAGYATAGPIIQVESLFANVYREPDVTRHKPVITIAFETRLELIPDETPREQPKADSKAGAKKVLANSAAAKPAGPKRTAAKAAETNPSHEGWLQVRLPGKTNAWIQSSDVVADPKPLSIPESIDLAKHFLGLPYLWGGTSSFGFDCSGFTQMLVRVRGITMPRDADKQAAWSGVIPVDRKNLQPGDLLFFGASARNITHTGMYIGDGQFIQATTNDHPVVQISRLDDDPWTHLLVASRRIKSESK
ncbi:MAG TPA: C40 family peptidase [Candidatus Binatus sp.]|jgi:cell wall-associated NlpC family hydrolase|nr:C40 family peptidase [Candidatus Binatus sp.]